MQASANQNVPFISQISGSKQSRAALLNSSTAATSSPAPPKFIKTGDKNDYTPLRNAAKIDGGKISKSPMKKKSGVHKTPKARKSLDKAFGKGSKSEKSKLKKDKNEEKPLESQ